ncbi:uncharacterized protein LOC131013435 isoform X2 [Salvia miltiorrhiza]|uniref:uncharacterized protein LOC131013435 isoform X2 n=1 Tax=Salvia miltiorrhiza TaxID=226208 RepID=UPI0025AD5D56|nr:uncharacterized protein LOC131013435 isoform X2 [Salvia miltiorrhiza]
MRMFRFLVNLSPSTILFFFPIPTDLMKFPKSRKQQRRCVFASCIVGMGGIGNTTLRRKNCHFLGNACLMLNFSRYDDLFSRSLTTNNAAEDKKQIVPIESLNLILNMRRKQSALKTKTNYESSEEQKPCLDLVTTTKQVSSSNYVSCDEKLSKSERVPLNSVEDNDKGVSEEDSETNPDVVMIVSLLLSDSPRSLTINAAAEDKKQSVPIERALKTEAIYIVKCRAAGICELIPLLNKSQCEAVVELGFNERTGIHFLADYELVLEKL